MKAIDGELGIHYGYPACCIAEWRNTTPLGHRNRPKRKLWGSGFVPCTACNEKSVDELIAEINSNRLASFPFVWNGKR